MSYQRPAKRCTSRTVCSTALLLLAPLAISGGCSKRPETMDPAESTQVPPPTGPAQTHTEPSGAKIPPGASSPEPTRSPGPTPPSTEAAVADTPETTVPNTASTGLTPATLIGTWTHEGERTTVIFQADGSCENRMTDCEDGPCRTATVRGTWKILATGGVKVRYPSDAGLRSPITYTFGAASDGSALYVDGALALSRQSGVTSQPGAAHICTVSVSKGGCEESDNDSPELKAELCFEDGTKESIRAKQCKTLYDIARKRAPERTVKSDGYAVTVAPGLIRTGDKTVVDHATGQCAELMCRTDFVSRQSKLLSFFGPYLTWSEKVSDAGGGGPPYHNTTWMTINLRTGAPANIVDLFEEASLLEAIRADSWVAQNFSAEQKSHLSKAASWAEVRPALAAYGFLTEGLERFAVYAYNRKKNLAAVRPAFKPEECGMCVNDASTLGLLLTPLPEAAVFLNSAARGRGFLMSTKNIDRLFH